MASLATIHPGDIVRVDKKGRLFEAHVTSRAPGMVLIKPIQKNVNYTSATSREIVRHWRLTKNIRKTGGVKATGQPDA